MQMEKELRVTISLFYHILLDQLVCNTEQKQAGVKRFLIISFHNFYTTRILYNVKEK